MSNWKTHQRLFRKAVHRFPCDTCGARPGETCWTARGFPTGHHRARRDCVDYDTLKPANSIPKHTHPDLASAIWRAIG